MRMTLAVVLITPLSLLWFFGFLGLFGEDQSHRSMANAAELKLAEGSTVGRFDFEQKGIEGWKTVDGQWTVEEMAGAPSGKKVLVQRVVQNQFNVIVAPVVPYT